MTTRAAIYARFSTDKQDGASIDDQIRVARARADHEGWQVVAEFVDEGISGSAIGNRPGVTAALRAGDAREFDVLIVMELQRLARGEDLGKQIQRLKFRGVRVIGVQDGFDSTQRTARMQAGMTGIMGGEFIEMISRRTHSALEMRAQSGRSAGGRAYGYTGKHEIVANEAQIIQEIFTRFAAGESMLAIASSLNARGVPSPGARWKRSIRRRDGRWLVSTMHSILHNEMYTGRVVWNRSQWVKDPDNGKRQRRLRPESEWVVHERPELALVDAPVWESAQRRLAARADCGGGKGGAPKYLLSGLLECGVCNAKMTVIGGKGQRYGCSSSKFGGEYACTNGLTVPRSLAEELILAPVLADLLSPAAVEHAVRAMRAAVREEVQAVPIGELTRIDDEAGELRALMADGKLDARRGEMLLAALEAERQALVRVRHNQAAPPSTAELAILYRETAQAWRERIRGADIAAARETLKGLVGTVRLHPEADHLVAHFGRGRAALLRAVGVDRLVAGAGFEPVYQPVPLRRRPA